jgi:hypothetical protein
MEQNIIKKPFNKRAFISSALFTSGLSLPISGFMNHYLQFEALTIARHFWMAAHDIAGLLFIIFSIIHLSFNWRIFTNYIKKSKEMIVSKETLSAFAFVLLIVVLISSHAFHKG